MSASGVDALVEDDKLSWDTPLIKILPDFRKENAVIQNQLKVWDLLLHYAGLAQLNALLMQDFGRLHIPKDQTSITASTLPTTSSPSEKFQYNDWNYALLALAVKERSGLSLGDFLMNRFFLPSGMTRTTVVKSEERDNLPEGYMALSNGEVLQIERPCVGDNQIMFVANGVNSCVKDLLIYYNELMTAGNDQFDNGTTSTAGSPFKQISTVLSGQSLL